MNLQKNILVAPLDWGLGHASRCIPVIRELIEQGANVVLASDGDSLLLLKKEFPELNSIELPGYKPVYPRFSSMWWMMLVQLPKFRKAIKRENELLEKIISDYHIHAVISDNRYGLSTDRVPCIFITHQLQIMMPPGFQKAGKLFNETNHRLIRNFDECWVPDFENEPNLSGDLSHFNHELEHVKFIGPLSRMKKNDRSEKKWKLLIILSGPEPQRSILEKKLISQLGDYEEGKCLFIRGSNKKEIQIKNSLVQMMNIANSEEIQQAMNESEIVVCRAGYSSIMDLVFANKKALLIPTPGQTEQKYLASFLAENKMFYSVEQNQLNLKTDIENAMTFNPAGFTMNENLLKKNIEEFLYKL